jgi:AcrR family transcriptional regulator
MADRSPRTDPLDQDPPAQTVLQRQLRASAPARRATALDAFSLAKQWFLRGDRLDMGGLSQQLGVNRATLYRWVGTREQLLVEVLWALAERTLSDELKRVEAEDDAGNRVARLLSRFVGDCLTNPGMRQLLRDEEGLAFRLLTLARYGFHPRFVKLVRDILAEDAAAGRLQTTVPLEDLAYTAVRVVESYVHRAAITGEEPDADRAARVLHALLR